jgi:hypothetical protein
VVLLLDDMQWADRATRNLLLYAARRWTRGGDRILVLLAVQVGSTATEELPSWTTQIEREAATTWLDLGALREAATHDLVDVLAGTGSAVARNQQEVSTETRLGAWLHSASGGKPGVILALLHRLLDAGRVCFRQASTGGWVLDPGTAWIEPDWRLAVSPVRLCTSIAACLEHQNPAEQNLLLVG